MRRLLDHLPAASLGPTPPCRWGQRVVPERQQHAWRMLIQELAYPRQSVQAAEFVADGRDRPAGVNQRPGNGFRDTHTSRQWFFDKERNVASDQLQLER